MGFIMGESETSKQNTFGTFFEFALRNEYMASFDRLVTMSSIYSIKQLKMYLF